MKRQTCNTLLAAIKGKNLIKLAEYSAIRKHGTAESATMAHVQRKTLFTWNSLKLSLILSPDFLGVVNMAKRVVNRVDKPQWYTYEKLINIKNSAIGLFICPPSVLFNGFSQRYNRYEDP